MTIRNIGYSVWGLRKTGLKHRPWRWLPSACGCISPECPKSKEYQMLKDIRRCREFTIKLDRLIRTYDITAIVVELLEGTQNSKAARTFGLVTGVLAAVVEKYTIPVFAYRAQAVKKTLTGSKSASKDAMIQAVLELHEDFCKKNGFKRKKSPRSKKLIWPGKLEHIADSMALVAHAEDQNDFRTITQLAVEVAERAEADDDNFFE